VVRSVPFAAAVCSHCFIAQQLRCVQPPRCIANMLLLTRLALQSAVAIAVLQLRIQQDNGTDDQYPLRLPKPNVFIPTDFSLRPVTPELLVSMCTSFCKSRICVEMYCEGSLITLSCMCYCVHAFALHNS
jgi:hypothetical protein